MDKNKGKSEGWNSINKTCHSHRSKDINPELDFDKAMSRVRKLAVKIRKDLDTWPGRDKNTLGDQLYRAIVSVPSNMSEGYGREPGNECQFMYIARGSAREAIEQIKIAGGIGLISPRRKEDWVAVLNNTIASIEARMDVVKSERKAPETTRGKHTGFHSKERPKKVTIVDGQELDNDDPYEREGDYNPDTAGFHAG